MLSSRLRTALQGFVLRDGSIRRVSVQSDAMPDGEVCPIHEEPTQTCDYTATKCHCIYSQQIYVLYQVTTSCHANPQM